MRYCKINGHKILFLGPQIGVTQWILERRKTENIVDGVETLIVQPNHPEKMVSVLPDASRHTIGRTKSTLQLKPILLQLAARLRIPRGNA